MLIPKKDTLKLLEEATSAYEKQLQQSDEALTYLQSRGISNEAQSYFRLGYVQEPIEGHENYKGRISFPYVTTGGITSIRFRAVGDPEGRAKFLSLPGDIPRLYNTNSLLEGMDICICEGQTDVIACWQAGIPAVGLPGAMTWKQEARVFSRIFVNRSVSVLADNDDEGAGMDFANDIYRTLGGCRIILMPKAHDVSSYLLKYGEEALRAKVNSSANG